MYSHGVGRLHIVSGTVKAMDYIEILQNKLLPTARDLFGNQSWIFQDDNAPCHRAKISLLADPIVTICDRPPRTSWTKECSLLQLWAVGKSICPDQFLSICVSSFVNKKYWVFKEIAFRSQPVTSDRSSKILIYVNNVSTRAVGSLVIRASDSRPEGLRSMPDATKYPPSTHGFPCRNCGGGDRGGVAIYRPFGEFRRAKSYCHLYGAQGQRQAYL
ncbi:hypothetical protein TNCV_2002601 [Trichonephila clavipes]|nr:hypothetical protein TNCV_2002601 [Trichonephila clavipes]